MKGCLFTLVCLVDRTGVPYVDPVQCEAVLTGHSIWGTLRVNFINMTRMHTAESGMFAPGFEAR